MVVVGSIDCDFGVVVGCTGIFPEVVFEGVVVITGLPLLGLVGGFFVGVFPLDGAPLDLLDLLGGVVVGDLEVGPGSDIDPGGTDVDPAGIGVVADSVPF